MDRWLATMSETSKLQQWLFWHNNICCLISQTLEFCQLMKHLYLIVTGLRLIVQVPIRPPLRLLDADIYIYTHIINM